MDDSHTPAKDPSSEPAKFQFQIGASDEEFDEPEVEIVVATHVVPPDGGWGWVVVAASFMCNAVVDGIIFSCGMLLHLFKEEFGVSTSDVAWVSSLLGGFYLIVGIGFGLIYVPAVIATGFYFEKRRALATGIAVCGSGIGTFIFAALNSFLIPSFGWRWTLVVYAGITLSCVVFGLAFRPLKPTTKFTTDDLEPPGTPLLMRIKRARDEQMKQCASALSMTSMNSKTPSRANLEEPFYDGEPGKVDALYVNNFSLMLGGGATMLLPMIVNESLLLAYSVAFGLSVAAFASLRSILLVELLGLEKLTNAFGLLLLFQGIAGIFGSPVAGAFVDLTKTYDISFYVFGGLFALSGVMCIPLRYIKEWEEKRNKRKHQECNAIEMKA
ncbi:Monocarboxylate transporter 13 [Portunus trituberculatus]|uniref:Monocarboxylate transporter 13 n=1 Tax=Portunus trituberculatus TaxID=210409 RepID=A0A5B7EMP4_PORTR|nr:Monocarboxylate transporter 13 [Portunus trituberculatus]